MAVEAKRGCGYRRVGGLYLVGGGLSAPCNRMPFALDRCPTCGAGVKFTRGHTWLQPDFFSVHEPEKVITAAGPGYVRATACRDEGPCPVCRNRNDFGPHLLLWIGRAHYSPESYLDESRKLGVSRRIAAMPKGLVIGETWVLLAHLDAVPVEHPTVCTRCKCFEAQHTTMAPVNGHGVCEEFQAPKPTPGIFSAFIPRAVELILKQSDATPERIEKEKKRGVTVVAVPDDDKDHQGSVWDKDEEEQPELPGVAS
jgi:hypothetical protein